VSELEDEYIFREIGKIVSKFVVYQCYDCAMAVMQWLRDNGIEGQIIVRIQVERKGRREGIANSQEWAEIASRKKAIAERA
jgi:Papain fold toxin 2